MNQISQEKFKDAPNHSLIFPSQSILKQAETTSSQNTIYLTDSQENSSMSEKSLDAYTNDRQPPIKKVEREEEEGEEVLIESRRHPDSRPTKYPKKETQRKQTTLGSFFIKK